MTSKTKLLVQPLHFYIQMLISFHLVPMLSLISNFYGLLNKEEWLLSESRSMLMLQIEIIIFALAGVLFRGELQKVGDASRQKIRLGLITTRKFLISIYSFNWMVKATYVWQFQTYLVHCWVGSDQLDNTYLSYTLLKNALNTTRIMKPNVKVIGPHQFNTYF